MIEFVVSLRDRVSSAAKAASSQVENLSSKFVGLNKNLVGVISPLTIANRAVAELGKGFDKLGSSLVSGSISGAVDGITKGMAGLAGMLDLVVPGLGTAATVAVRVTGTFFELVAKTIELTVAQSELRAALLQSFDALGEGPGAGASVLYMLDDLAGKIPQTRTQLGAWTKEFQALGVTGVDALRDLTTAAASAHALLRDPAAAENFITLQRKITAAAESGEKLKIPVKGLGSLTKSGLTVIDVAKQMGLKTHDLAEQLRVGSVNATKFGEALTKALIAKGVGPLDTMMSEISVRFAKAKDSFGLLFALPAKDLEPLSKALGEFFNMFSTDNVVGDSLHKSIGGTMKYIVELLAKGVDFGREMFLTISIWALKAFNAVAPLIISVLEFFEMNPSLSNEMWMGLKMTLGGIGIILGGIVVFAGLVVIGFTAIVAGAAYLFGLLGDWFISLGYYGAQAVDELWEWGKKMFSIGSDFVMGLIDGIRDGTAKLLDTVGNMAMSVVDKVKSIFKVNSPSLVMKDIGLNVGDGLSQGIDASKGKVEASSDELSKGSIAGISSGSGGGSSDNSKSISVNVGGIHITGGTGDLKDITEEAISLIFERVALQEGVI